METNNPRRHLYPSSFREFYEAVSQLFPPSLPAHEDKIIERKGASRELPEAVL
jgi:hypothetical protein